MVLEKERNWLSVLPYAIYLMNNQFSPRTGYSPHELFFGRPGFHMVFPTPQDANAMVKEWTKRQTRLASKAKEMLESIRERKYTHASTVDAKPPNTRSETWYLCTTKGYHTGKRMTSNYRPFLVTEVTPSSVRICASPGLGREIEVGLPFLKRYILMDEYGLDLEDFDKETAPENDELNDAQDLDITSELAFADDFEGEGQLLDMNAQEVKAKGFYMYKQYCTRGTGMGGDSWSSGSITLWQKQCGNPTQRLLWTKGNVSLVVRDYCYANELQKLLKLAEARSKKEHDAHSK